MRSSENLGSVASTETKNLSLEKPANRSELKIGWWCRGRRFRWNMPKTAANDERSTVSSNMIGTIDGRLYPGLPPMMIG